MQFDAEDFFLLDKMREDLKKSFLGLEDVVDVYWRVYYSAFSKGTHRWLAQVTLIYDSFNSKDSRYLAYDKEAKLYSDYPAVLWDFKMAYLKNYSSHENFIWNMERSGFSSVDPLKSLGKGDHDTSGKPH